MGTENSMSRRKFIGRSVAGMGTLGLGASHPPELLASQPSSEDSPDRSSREVSVLSVTMHRISREHKHKTVEQMLTRLESLQAYEPDVICLPEAFATKVTEAESIDGPLVQEFAAHARQHSCYVICPLHTKRDGKIFNTAVLLDRSGQIIGKYDKIHPNQFECDDGICPAAGPPPVFKTDFGTIAIQICFDFNWIDDWRYLKENGAEIVFWPSAYPGGRMLSGLAWLYKYYVVGTPAINPALIYDMTGDLVSRSGRWEGHAFAKLNLEKMLFEVDFNVPQVPEIRKKYGTKVSIQFFHDEDWLTIESLSQDLTIAQLVKEFDLIPHWEYIKQANEVQEGLRI